ncbi:MAG: DegV family protein [Clostridia bacterium]|nr:DegV family protein [Clostridia bacterium]
MKKVAIVTDSNAGIHQSEGIQDLFIVPMPFTIDGDEFFEDVNLSANEFYAAQDADKRISTSQPSPGDVLEIWNKILETYDELVFIPMSSGLSKTYDTAKMLSADFGGRVHVADAKRISVTMRHAVLDALKLAEQGIAASEICEILEKHALDASIYIMVDTLKHLKRGGRITPVVAAFGTLLHIKPVLTIQGDKLDSYAKVMNINQGKKKMIDAIRKDIENRFLDDFKNKNLIIDVVHAKCRNKAEEFASEVKSAFPDVEFGCIDELSLSVASHIGAGALAITITKKLS